MYICTRKGSFGAVMSLYKADQLNFLENDLSLRGGGNAKLCLILEITLDNLVFSFKKMFLADQDIFNLCSIWDRQCPKQIFESILDNVTFILVILQ